MSKIAEFTDALTAAGLPVQGVTNYGIERECIIQWIGEPTEEQLALAEQVRSNLVWE